MLLFVNKAIMKDNNLHHCLISNDDDDDERVELT